jgi:biotin operon repressor
MSEDLLVKKIAFELGMFEYDVRKVIRGLIEIGAEIVWSKPSSKDNKNE